MIKRIINSQIYQLVTASGKELIREPGVLFWGIVFPILMSLGLGIAFTNKKDVVINIAVIGKTNLIRVSSDTVSVIGHFLERNKAPGETGKDGTLIRKFVLSDDKLGNTVFIFREMSWTNALVLLKRGNLNIVLDEKAGHVEYHFDPMNPDAQLTYLKLSKIMDDQDPVKHESAGEIKPLTVSGTRYIDFLIPGLIAMGVMMSSLWGISYGIIERRSKKLLRRMVATPMKKSNFLIALIVVRLVMNFLEAFLLFLFAFAAFGITIQGNIAALIAIFISGNLAFAGISIFLSSHTAKTEIGNGLINAISMPMMVLSGIFFSYHNFPEWSISVIQQLPLTMLADGMRSIFIEGAGFSEIAIPVLVLSATGVLFFMAGLRIFKWH